MAVALPNVVVATPPEPFAPVELEHGCDPTEKPGVVAFRDFLLQNVGGGNLGITRPCDVGKASEHWAGRAFDWALNADDPADAARADAVINWLFADDAAVFRRLGLMYLIWDGQIWSTTFQEWRAYTGPSPHRDHIHFSFSWPGALGQTSFFTWLRGGAVPPGLTPGRMPAMPAWAALLALTAGAVVGWYGLRRLARR